jgi:hypothetical protein
LIENHLWLHITTIQAKKYKTKQADYFIILSRVTIISTGMNNEQDMTSKHNEQYSGLGVAASCG